MWDIDRPKLYHVVARLLADGQPRHERRARIGFREAAFARDGFYLNGRRVKLFGVSRHQFFPFTGAAMPDRVQARDAEIIRRELNCNMVRCSHYPQSAAFLDACDELGLMVFSEAPGWGYLGDQTWLALAYRDIADMITRDRNRPSVILWGARLNETPSNTAFYTATNELAHTLDDSRPTAGAMAGMRLSTDYQQDVFAENDYSTTRSLSGAQGSRRCTAGGRTAGRTWSPRLSAHCPGRPATTAAPTRRPSSRGRRRHTRWYTPSPPPMTGTAGCWRGPGSITRPAAAIIIRG